MKKLSILLVLLAVIGMSIFGQTNPKPSVVNIELMKKIYMELPNSVFPKEMQTAEQRKEALDYEHSENVLRATMYNGDIYTPITAAFYPFDDKQNILLIVQWCLCLDGCFLQSDKTFNYNIKSGKLTETKRPIEPFTSDDLIDRIDFGEIGQSVKDKIKRWFNESSKVHKIYYTDINADGYAIAADYRAYDDGKYNFDFFYDWDNPSQAASTLSYQWNGKRFVKIKEPLYSCITIRGTNVNLRDKPRTGTVVMQANNPDIFIVESVPVIIKDDGSVWYKICYSVDKKGNITDIRHKTKKHVFVAARLAMKSPLEAGYSEKIVEADK